MNTSNVTPPPGNLQGKLIPVILKLKNCYKIWQMHLQNFPKANRYTLGSKIDDIFLNAIEFTFLASYSNLIDKLPLVDKAISRADLIKLLILLAYEIQALDTNKYIQIGTELDEASRMLGGWRKQIIQKTSQENLGKKNY